jgi:hypothetical protein
VANRAEAASAWRGLALAGAVALALALPLLGYFAQHPDQFLAHPSDVSLAAIAARDFDGSLPAAVAHNAGAVAGMFALAGDPSTFHNLPGLPVFDPLSALLAAVGLGVLLGGLAAGGLRRDQAVLLLLWLVLLLVPTLLSDRAPNYSRAIAALPVIVLLPALGLDWLLGHLPAERAAWRWGLAALALLVAGTWTIRHYFGDFAALDHAYYSYDVDKVDAYRALRALPGDPQVFLHPLWAEHATIDFLNADGAIRPLDGRRALVMAPDGRDTVIAFPAKEADKEGWLDEARALYGPVATPGVIQDAKGKDILRTLRIPAASAGDGEPPTDAPLEPEQWTAARFGGMIDLLGYRIGEARPGQPLPITLYWSVEEPINHDWTTFVHLLGPGATGWGQEDRPPGDGSFPTSRWQSHDRIVDQFAPVLSPEAHGPVTIRVGWYDPQTGERLTIGLADEFNLKPVQAGP